MKAIQDKVLEEVAKILESEGFSPAQKQKFANTGTVLAMKDFRVVFRVQYQFHDDACGLVFLLEDETWIHPGSIEGPHIVTSSRWASVREHGRGDFRVRYEGDDISHVLETLRQFAMDMSAQYEATGTVV